MKWYTCTPVPFKGDHTFFSRDSGAFCKAFQRIGLESRAIMPTPVQEGDDPDLIRTEYANLEDAAWWKSAPGMKENAARRKFPATGAPCCMRKTPASASLPLMRPPKAAADR